MITDVLDITDELIPAENPPARPCMQGQHYQNTGPYCVSCENPMSLSGCRKAQKQQPAKPELTPTELDRLRRSEAATRGHEIGDTVKPSKKAMDPESIKICGRCGLPKQRKEFWVHNRAKDGYRGECKACLKPENAAHYARRMSA